MAVTLHIGTMATPLGGLLLAVDAAGHLRAADFADCEDRLRRLLDRRLGPSAYSLSPGPAEPGIARALAAYFSGDIGALAPIPVHLDGAPFQNLVWTALRSIEPGQPLAYSLLAERLGRPRAARAVGNANGANPFSIIVPCHRLIGAGGALTGYAGGMARKRWLLDHEARHASVTRDGGCPPVHC